jgi:UDP-glucose 4-epimerase
LRVFVTGGAGFIGSHLVDCLVQDGYDVRVLDDLSSGKLENLSGHLSSGKVDFVEGDIRDSTVVGECLSGVNVVVHLAALTSVPFSVEHPDLTFDVNVSGTLNLLRFSAKLDVDKFVFASSCAVFGDPQVLPVNEDSVVCPISPYAESKLLGERYCLGFGDRRLLKPVVLRFFNVYGPRQGLSEYSGVITRFVDRCRRGLPLVVYGDGSQTRDFVSVFDVVEAIVSCVKSGVADGNVFNVGSGAPTSVNELAKAVIELAGVGSEILYEEPRVGDIKDSYADISKARALLGYWPRVGLRDGLRNLLKNELKGS